jgi:hypothetical protein
MEQFAHYFSKSPIEEITITAHNLKEEATNSNIESTAWRIFYKNLSFLCLQKDDDMMAEITLRL